jgi:S-adenosylmethionine/arginine decarboxylase-like enzyme
MRSDVRSAPRGRGQGDTAEFYARARNIAAVKPFGYLLTLDCYDCTPLLMCDLRAAYWLLDTLANALGMLKQAPPFVFISPPQYTDKAGISGWVPLIESGIQIHTLTARNFVSLDIYCCRRIERRVVVELVQDCYAPGEIESNEIARGTKYHDG